MKMIVAAAVGLLALSGHALAQETDDWEYAEDAAAKTSVAAVRYASGQSIVARCVDGDLTVAVTGMPQREERALRMNVRRFDGRAAAQMWMAAPEGTWTIYGAERAARLMRGGGALDVETVPALSPRMTASFDLPASSANLDRVLTACDRPLETDRDGLKELSLANYDFMPGVVRRIDNRDGVTGNSRAELSCLVGPGERLRDCRVERETPRGRFGRAAARALNGQQVDVYEDVPTEGGVVYLVVMSYVQP